MNKFQQFWIENESLRAVMQESIEEASRQLGVKLWINQDGTIGGDYSEDQYNDGIKDDAESIALTYVYENS